MSNPARAVQRIWSLVVQPPRDGTHEEDHEPGDEDATGEDRAAHTGILAAGFR
jgi:hypothetical protein